MEGTFEINYPYGISPYNIEYLPNIMVGKVDKEYL